MRSDILKTGVEHAPHRALLYDFPIKILKNPLSGLQVLFLI